MDTAPPVAVDTADAGDPTPSVAVDTAGDPSPSVERGVETSPPLSDRDVQGSNSDSGLADVGEGEAALWGDGCLDDIDMIELADLVSFFLFSTPREKRKRDRETISIPFVFFPFPPDIRRHRCVIPHQYGDCRSRGQAAGNRQRKYPLSRNSPHCRRSREPRLILFSLSNAGSDDGGGGGGGLRGAGSGRGLRGAGSGRGYSGELRVFSRLRHHAYASAVTII